MKDTHLTYEDLAMLLSDLLDRPGQERLTEHLQVCSACRERHEELRRLFSSERRVAQEAGPALERRILDSYDRMAAEGDAAPGYSGFRKIGYAAALAASIVLSVVLYQLYAPPSGRVAEVVAVRIEGDITVNGAPGSAGMTILQGSSIRAAKDAVIFIKTGGIADIVLAGPGSMRVAAAGIDAGKRSLDIDIELQEGDLLSRIHHGKTKARCRYRTDQAVVESLSTEYLVRVGGGSTTVIVRSGRVAVISTRSGIKRIIVAGEKAAVAAGIEVLSPNSEDLSMLERLHGAMGTPHQPEKSPGGGSGSEVRPWKGDRPPATGAVQVTRESKDAGTGSVASPKGDSATLKDEGDSARKEMKEFRKHSTEMKRSGMQRNRRNR